MFQQMDFIFLLNELNILVMLILNLALKNWVFQLKFNYKKLAI